VKKILPVILALAVLAGVGYFLMGRQPETGPVATQREATSEETEVTEPTLTGRLQEMLALGQSLKCTWRRDDQNFGTTYIKGKKVYSDTTANGQRAHAIVVDNCTYFWEEGAAQGMTMCFEPEAAEETGETPDTEEYEELFAQTPDVNYQCVKAVASEGLFKPPTNVNFTNLQQMMESTTGQ